MLKHLTDEQLLNYYILYKKGVAASSRFESRKIHQADTKFLYHIIRLLLEVEQILTEGTLNLEINREILKSIRRGEWTLEKLTTWFNDKERQLEEAYHKSDLPWGPQENKIKTLLLETLQSFYGNDLSKCVTIKKDANILIDEIYDKITNYKRLIN